MPEFKIPQQLPKFSYRGEHAYTVSACAFHERKDFDTDATRALLQKTLQECAAEHGFELVAFSVKNSKVSFLARGKNDESDLRAFVDHFKRKTERAWQKAKNQPLWLPGYWDHVLRKREPIEAFADAVRTGSRLPIGFAIQATQAVAA